MEWRGCAILGVIGPLVAYFFIGASVMLSPWFNWQENALSDLGHAIRSRVAPIFNFGLLAAGLLVAIYSVMMLRKYAKHSGRCLLGSSFALQLIATFDEAYGFLHYVVSVLFFVLLGLTSIVYSIERRSPMALIAFMMGLSSWILYWAGAYNAGVAVPEIISSAAASLWITSSALEFCSTRGRNLTG